ncbi:MAG: oligoendopeptidase F [Candidatus Neomarinimicrobiota bacterium]|nr:MAG: oligoendopeptidase F [Candidatus Neomarinimicrobiota bacterium]
MINTRLRILPWLILTVCLSLLTAKPKTLKRAEIPDQYKWNLSDIYADWDAWQQDYERLQQLMNDYAALKGTLSSGPEALVTAYQLSDELGMLADKVYSYASLNRDVDSRNNDVSAKLQQVQILFSQFGTATAWFDPELLQIPWDTLSRWLEETPALAPYRFSIENLHRQQSHVLDEEGERLLSYFSRFNSTPRSIHSELSTSDIQFPDVVLSTGDSVTVTPGQYRLILNTNRNQADRRLAFESRNGVYNATINTYAAIYNGICQRDWALAQARNYASTLEAALDDDNVPVDVYLNLIHEVRKGTEPLQKYHRLRKQALGLDEYHLYDSSIPVVDFNKTYEYDDVAAIIEKGVSILGKDYGKKLDQAFHGGWVDVYENEGKRGGAYSSGVYGVHPYMLLNYSDTMDDMFTVAHEMGHSMHTMYANETQPFATSQYTIFVAEVASTLNEALLLDYLMEHTRDTKERIALLSHAIDNIAGTFYTQVMFADFELQAHQLAEEGKPITAEVLNGIYRQLLEDYFGDAVAHDDLYDITWARIPHFYFAPYYVYQYATCFASSAKIVSDMKAVKGRKRKQVVERYLNLLKSGGNDYPMEQLKKAGVDLSQPETIQAVIRHMNDLVNQLEIELNKL